MRRPGLGWLWSAWRLRRASTAELVDSLEACPADSEAEPRAAAWLSGRLGRWVDRVRVVARVAGGFRGPMREAALLALVLRRSGWPAFLVIGHEPVPVMGLRRRLVVWVELEGVVVAGMGPSWLYPELARYPSRRATSERPGGLLVAGEAGR